MPSLPSSMAADRPAGPAADDQDRRLEFSIGAVTAGPLTAGRLGQALDGLQAHAGLEQLHAGFDRLAVGQDQALGALAVGAEDALR